VKNKFHFLSYQINYLLLDNDELVDEVADEEDDDDDDPVEVDELDVSDEDDELVEGAGEGTGVSGGGE